MKLGTRILPTMVAAFFLAPTLFADDTARPVDSVTKNAPASSAAPLRLVDPKPGGKALLAQPAKSFPQGPEGAQSGKHAEAHEHHFGRADHSVPKVELFMGYSYWRAVPESDENRIAAMHGGSTNVAFNFNRHFGLVVDFAGFKVDSLQFVNLTPAATPSRVVDAEGNVFTLMAGPRVSFRGQRRLTPFLQILGGVARASRVTVDGCAAPIYACTPLPQETVFIMAAGGGLDFKLNHRFALRILQAEYLLGHFQDPTSATGASGWQNNVRLSAGIVFRFGGDAPTPPPPANHSPTVSCSLDKAVVYAGTGDIVAVHAAGSDPDNDSLTYTYSATAGTVEGTGPDARFSSSGLPAGSYTINVMVDDAKGGTATCATNISVMPRQNQIPTISCATDRNPILPGERTGITTTASDADNDPLTYSYSASAGHILGDGAKVRFDSTGLPPGSYVVKCSVNDGKGGTADTSTNIDVQQPPAPPQATKVGSCNYTKPGTSRFDNACKRVGDDVALRLKNDPAAKLVVVGFADPSEHQPAKLASTRANLAGAYLGEKGIDASRINTRSGTASTANGMSNENRRVDFVIVPEGATY